MMFWKANLEVNWLMWKWTRTGFLYPTSGCKTPEIVLLNDLHSVCVCNFYFILYVSKYEIHEIQGSSGPQHLFNFELYWLFVRFLRCQVLKLNSPSFSLPTQLIMSRIQKGMLDSNNTEYKKTDNIKKQQIPKIQTMTFKDGAVAEEGLWISRSLIPLIPLAFSFAIEVAAINFPNMIWTGRGMCDFYIVVSKRHNDIKVTTVAATHILGIINIIVV